MIIDVKQAVEDIRKDFSWATESQVKSATSRAMNRAAITIRDQIQKDIRKEYNLRARDIKAALSIQRAKGTELSVAVSAKGGFIPIYQFKGTKIGSQITGRQITFASSLKTRKVKAFRGKNTKTGGISFEVKKGQKVFIQGAFIQRMKSGHTGVYARGKYTAQGFQFRHKRVEKGGSDLPIAELRTASVPGMFTQAVQHHSTTTLFKDVFITRFEHELKYITRSNSM